MQSDKLSAVKNWAELAGKANYNSKALAGLLNVSLRGLERLFHARARRSPATG